MNVFHVSDLHVRSKPGMNDVVRSKLSAIKKSFCPGDVLVVTGDITDDGHAAQYALAGEMLMPFKGALAVVPGNHDFGPWGNVYSPECVKRFAQFRHALGCDTPCMLDYGGAPFGQVIALDSTLRTRSMLDLAQGKVGWWRLRRLKSQLEAMRKAGAVSIVAVHHSPYAENFALRLQDGDAFLRAVLGKADHVLMGHEHREFLITFPPQCPGSTPITTMHGAGALHHEKTVIGVIHVEKR